MISIETKIWLGDDCKYNVKVLVKKTHNS